MPDMDGRGPRGLFYQTQQKEGSDDKKEGDLEKTARLEARGRGVGPCGDGVPQGGGRGYCYGGGQGPGRDQGGQGRGLGRGRGRGFRGLGLGYFRRRQEPPQPEPDYSKDNKE
ncbi:hypothetical protein JW711_06000 [Candidatus Woesearchaeota archaeon]|nr:hypothetical protein [Candidatus Woesearchaeota archaeon]